MDAVLANNEDFRRNDDLTELRQVVENVNCEMENTNAPMQQKAPPKGKIPSIHYFKLVTLNLSNAIKNILIANVLFRFLEQRMLLSGILL